MPGRCCVPLCDNECGGHEFPKNEALAKDWRGKIRRIDPGTGQPWKFGKRDVVCHGHFTPESYRAIQGKRKRLVSGAVPSIFPYQKQPSETALARTARYKKRKLSLAPGELETSIPVKPTTPNPVPREPLLTVITNENQEIKVVIGPNTQLEILIVHKPRAEEPYFFGELDLVEEIVTSSIPVDLDTEEQDEEPEEIIKLEYPLKLVFMSIESIKNNPTMISYYTSFNNYNHFMYFFHLLGPSTSRLKYQCECLEPVNQCFLTVMKFRQAKEDIELGYLFGVSKTSATTIVKLWTNFMFYELKEINIWPSKEIVKENMPKNFKKRFPNTRVVLDATEIPIAKPSEVNMQCATFSTYKHKNTAKAIIGITPAGSVSFISDTYGGSTSDRQIVERSILCTEDGQFSPCDSIMADRGLMVQDLFATKDVKVNTPHMLNGKSQLDNEEVVHDRRVSSKRIHVERIIGLGKTYKILKKELPATKRLMAGRILFICYFMVNLREPIVGPFA